MEDELTPLATVYTKCQNCDHESEFYGVVIDDVAYFPCLACRTVFTIGNIEGWAAFLDDEDDDE